MDERDNTLTALQWHIVVILFESIEIDEQENNEKGQRTRFSYTFLLNLELG